MAEVKPESASGDDSPAIDTTNLDSFDQDGGSFVADPNALLVEAQTTGVVAIGGTDGDDNLVIHATGADSGSYSLNGGPAVAFKGVTSFTFNGGAGNDNVTVNNPDGGLFAPAGGIFVNGGTQNGDPGDGLRLVGGVADTAIYNTDAHHADGKDGSIVLNLGGVTATYTYTGLEPLANTGTAANVVFNLPAGPGTAFLEDDGGPFNGISRLRSFEGKFETTDFAHPTSSLTINSGAGQTIIVTLDNDSSIENLTIGSLTNSALSPDAINIGNVSVGNTITLAATGEITELFSDAANDISAVRVALSAGTGIGVGNAIELAPPLGFIAVEAQTNTGGIFLSSTASLNIGGVTSSLTGLKVTTSGDIDIVTGGRIVLQDTDGPEVIRGGSSSGNVRLAGNDASADLIITVDRDAIVTPAGSIDARVGRDILLGTAGANFDNDVRASGFVFLRGERDFILDGQSNISSDDFGLNTGGSVNVGAGGNITIANAQGNGASIGASGNAGAGVQLFTGAGGLLSLNALNPAALFSTSGNVTAHANHLAIQSGSGISALGHTVTINR
jgi:hypothetical protein